VAGVSARTVCFLQPDMEWKPRHVRQEDAEATATACAIARGGRGLPTPTPRGRSVSVLIALHCAARLDGDGTHPEQTWRCLVESNLGYGQI
jgi:hypothetical protein